MKNGITLITPTHGNPISLKRTIDSVRSICNEVVIGELCMFDEDREAMYARSFSVDKTIIVKYMFNELYKHGFSHILNDLSEHASNDIVIYLNVGEVVDIRWMDACSNINSEYNAWYIDHGTEKHRWWRCYNRKELKWSGRIHEELIGDFRPYHKPIITFADTDKDMDNPFKAWVANDIKEMVYWRQLMHIVDHPEELGATNAGWLQFAKDQYESMKERMNQKGDRVKAFDIGRWDMYFDDMYNNPNLVNFPFESNEFIEFQGSPMFLGKK